MLYRWPPLFDCSLHGSMRTPASSSRGVLREVAAHLIRKVWRRSARCIRLTEVLALTILFLLFAGQASAQAVPPFRTDDPETPGNKHWEINVGWHGDRNPDEGSYSVPNLDINYGLRDRIQLKYELPLAMHEERGAADEA